MSVSQNFPDEGPSLSLNFAGAEKLDSRITFTRSSSGTYLDRNGLVVTAPANSPRFEHSYNGSNVESLGLLIEESRTNLVTYSEQFDNAVWSKVNAGITTNTSATTAPDGSNNADLLLPNTTNAQHRLDQSPTSSTTTQVFSVYAKSGGYNFVGLRIGSIGSSFDLSTGEVSSSSAGSVGSIQNVGNGWYRCSIVVSGALSNDISRINVTTAVSPSSSFAGDGTSGIYIWGAQLEAGAFPTSYIPTVASTVTRSADNASMTGTNFSSWYNSTASTGGTILVQARRGYSGNFSGYPNLYTISDGTSNNSYIAYGVDASTQFTNYAINTSGVLQTDYVFGTLSTTNLFKSIHSFATNSSTFCVNGSLTTTDTSVTLPTVTRLNIGQTNTVGSNLWNGTISSLSYYPTRLTNSQLQNLTK
jgi:hypothetical protein